MVLSEGMLVGCSTQLASCYIAELFEMSDSESNIVERARKELEQILGRMRLNCEHALEIIRDTDRDELSPESREQLLRSKSESGSI